MRTRSLRPQRQNSVVDPARLLRRTLFGGYRADDVLRAIRSLQSQLDPMAESLENGWRERERLSEELAALHKDLEYERGRAARAEGLAAERAAEVEAQARAMAARLLAEAEEQASRLRSAAALRVGEATASLEDVLGVREQLLGEMRGILRAYGGLLDNAELGRPPVPVLVPQPSSSLLAEVVPEPGEAGLFPRKVQLDAGPFADFAELAAFERSLTRLPKVEDVHIRRFAQDRAEIELTLSEQTALVHDLASHVPYPMDVVLAGEDSLVVDVRQKEAS